MGYKTKKAMKLNGVYIEDLIPGYTTLNVSGRESLEGSLSIIDRVDDGSIYVDKKYKSRSLTISFVIEKDTDRELREALELLSIIINVANAEVIFDDEPDKYFTASKGEGTDFGISLGVATGTFDLYCADPFKYSVDEITPAKSNFVKDGEQLDAFIVDNKGYKTFPKFNLKFNSDCGYTLFTKSNNVNQFVNGQNVRVIAGEEYTIDGQYTSLYFLKDFETEQISVETTIRTDDSGNNYESFVPDSNGLLTVNGASSDLKVIFSNKKEYALQFGNDTDPDTTTPLFTNIFTESKMDGWAADSSITLANEKYVVDSTGTVAVKDTGLYSSKYGTNVKDKYYGPIVVHDIGSPQSGDFTFTWKNQIVCDAKKMGCFQVVLMDSDKKPVYTLSIEKNKNIKTPTVLFYKGTEEVSWVNTPADISAKTNPLGSNSVTVNKKTTYTPKDAENYITRKDGVVSVSVALCEEELTVVGTDNTAIKYIGFYYGAFNKTNFTTLYVRYADYVGCAYDLKNTFSNGDTFIVDCKGMDVTINGVNKSDIGSIANEWNDFYLDSGVNYFFIDYSKWDTLVKPDVTLSYRERWL